MQSRIDMLTNKQANERERNIKETRKNIQQNSFTNRLYVHTYIHLQVSCKCVLNDVMLAPNANILVTENQTQKKNNKFCVCLTVCLLKTSFLLRRISTKITKHTVIHTHILIWQPTYNNNYNKGQQH